MKIVINACFGGFSVSKAAMNRMEELGAKIENDSYGFLRGTERTDPYLVQVVEELGPEAGGSCAELIVVEIPDDIEYEISEYDGFERVEEKHRSWP